MYEEYYKKLREECLIRNRSSQTAVAYIHSIRTFMRWTGDKPMECLTLSDARDFILEKRKNGIKASTCTDTMQHSAFYTSMCFTSHGIWKSFRE